MGDDASRGPAHEPQELERLLVSMQHAGDLDGMVALYETDAVIDCGGGRLLRGHAAIREFFREVAATGQKFQRGEQRPALLCGDLALTSTRLPDGNVTAEVARRQRDGRWLWAIDQFSISSETASHARGETGQA